MINYRMFIHKPTVVLAARVNMPVVEYPLGEINFDGVTAGSHSNVRVDMTVLFGNTAGSDDLGSTKVSAIASGVLNVGRLANGKPGEQVVDIVDNCHITILNEYRVWAKIPYINPADTSEQSKDGYISSVEGIYFPPPVANGGGPVAGTIDSGTGFLVAQFDGSNSFQFELESSTGISGVDAYLWNVVDGNIISGTSASAAITVEFPPGFRYVSLTVTKDYGASTRTHTCRIPVYARDPDDDESTDRFQIITHTRGKEGQALSVRLFDHLPRSEYRDGSMVLIWDDNNYDSSETRDSLIFYGWMSIENNSTQSTELGHLINTVLQLEDVAGRMRATRAFSQAQEYIAEPTLWKHTQRPTLVYYVWYLLYWHSTVVTIADLIWPYSGIMSQLEFKILSSDEGDLFTQVNTVASAVTPDHHLYCNRIGQLIFNIDPFLVDHAERSEDLITDFDWSEIFSLTYTYNPAHRVGRLLTFAFIGDKDIDPEEDLGIACMAPTEGRGQGAQTFEIANKIATNQINLNACEGNRFARINAPYGLFEVIVGFSSSINHQLDPAFEEWVGIDIPEGYLPHREESPGFVSNSFRGIIQQVNFTYNYTETGTTVSVSFTWEKETWGPPASTFALTDPTP